MPADQFALKLAASLPIVGSLYDGEEKMLGGIEDLIGGTLRWAGASEKVWLRWSSTATQIAYAKNQFEGLDRMRGIMQPFNNAAASSFERIRLANAKPGDDTQQTQMEIRFAEEQRKLKAMRNRMADLQRKADAGNYIATPAERDELAALRINLPKMERETAAAEYAEMHRMARDNNRAMEKIEADHRGRMTDIAVQGQARVADILNQGMASELKAQGLNLTAQMVALKAGLDAQRKAATDAFDQQNREAFAAANGQINAHSGNADEIWATYSREYEARKKALDDQLAALGKKSGQDANAAIDQQTIGAESAVLAAESSGHDRNLAYWAKRQQIEQKYGDQLADINRELKDAAITEAQRNHLMSNRKLLETAQSQEIQNLSQSTLSTALAQVNSGRELTGVAEAGRDQFAASLEPQVKAAQMTNDYLAGSRPGVFTQMRDLLQNLLSGGNGAGVFGN